MSDAEATMEVSENSDETTDEGGTPIIRKNPDLEIAQLRYVVGLPSYPEDRRLPAEQLLLEKIEEHKMAPFYKDMCQAMKKPMNQALYDRLAAENTAALKEMDEAIKYAEENLSETDVRDAWMKKAEYLCEIGDKAASLSAFRQAYEKVVGIGRQLDVTFQVIRIGLFWMDDKVLAAHFAKAKDLMETGGDWDRKNRLKVYEGLYSLAIRDFRKAADLLLDCVSTFTSTELMTYEQLVFYAVAAGMLTLNRQELKSKVVQGAEVTEQLYKMPELKRYLRGLYDCEYEPFFHGLAWIEEQLKFDRILSPHYMYYVRGMRALAYKQLLSSYRSLSLEYMAKTFGVTVDFIDKELHKMVAAGHLHCKIDRVKQVVETNQLDNKNLQYHAILKDGDILLNRIQKLGRIINA